jgi:uncharacterized protein YdhG (YjbR/CyaY superfamily)
MKITNPVDEYIQQFPAEIQLKLQEMRSILLKNAPKAEEVISYGMPAIKTTKVLVYYAANKAHLGLYPTGSPTTVFKDELTQFKTSKGAIQFTYNKPLPKTLIGKIVKYRLKEEIARSKPTKK